MFEHLTVCLSHVSCKVKPAVRQTWLPGAVSCRSSCSGKLGSELKAPGARSSNGFGSQACALFFSYSITEHLASAFCVPGLALGFGRVAANSTGFCWGDGLAIKSAGWSCSRPELGSQQLTRVYNPSSRGPDPHTMHIHTSN